MIDILIVMAALASAPPASLSEKPVSREACTVRLGDLLQPLRLSYQKLRTFESQHLRFRFRLTPVSDQLQPEGLNLTLADGTVYPANRAGAFDIPLVAFLQGEETSVQIGPSCAGGFAIGAELAVSGIEGATVDGRTIRAAIAEYDAMIEKQGFLVRLFAPKLRTLVVRFPLNLNGECAGLHNKGEDRFQANAQQELGISLRRFLSYKRFTCQPEPEEILLSAD